MVTLLAGGCHCKSRCNITWGCHGNIVTRGVVIVKVGVKLPGVAMVTVSVISHGVAMVTL